MTRLRSLFPVLALLFGFAAAAHADDFTRDLQVGSAPELYVVTGSGSVRVHAGDGSRIHVVGHVHAGGGWHWGKQDDSDADARVRQIAAHPPIQQAGNDVRIAQPGNDALYRNITIDYEITAPANVALNLQTGSGDVEVDQLGRFLHAQSGSGSLRAHGVHGAAELQTGSGDIELEQLAPGGNVKAQSGSGSIRIHGFEGSLNARAGSGDIEADGDLRGPAALQSGSGSIRLHIQRDAHFNLNASTGSGSIRVNFPGAPQQDRDDRHAVSGPVNGGGPTIEARTGSGDISIDPR